jgi:hypothetical protein
MLLSEDGDVKWEEYTKTENEKLRLVTYIVSDD